MSLLEDVSIVVTPNGYKAGTLYGVLPTYAESEKVTNGTFTGITQAASTAGSEWTTGAGWTIGSGIASRASYSSNTYLSQNVAIVAGRRYEVKYDRTYASGGGQTNLFSEFITSGSNTTLGILNSTTVETVTVTDTFIPTYSGDMLLRVYGIGDFTGTIDNVSVKEITSSDMDVTRATAATRVDENGLVNYAEVLGGEEITNGKFTTNLDSWSTSSWWVWNALGAYHPSTSSHKPLYQQCCVIGKTYLITFDLNCVGTSQAKFSLGSSTGSTTQVIGTSLTSGSYSYFVTAAAEYIVFNRQNTAEYYVNNVSVKEAARDNVPRIDYTGGGCPHILAEPQRTNLLRYSEDFSEWNMNGTSAVDGGVSSIGLNYYTITNTGGGFLGIYYQSAGFSHGDTITTSLYIKKGTSDSFTLRYGAGINQNVEFDLDDGTVVSEGTNVVGTIQSMSDGWYRVTSTWTDAAHTFSVADVALYVQSGNVEISGAQCEVGSYVTSYIPNFGTSSGVTRNEDIFTRDGIGSLINSAEGVLFAELSAFDNDVSYRYMGLTDGTADNRVIILYYSGVNTIRVLLSSGGTKYFDDTYAVTDITDFHKIAVKWKVNDFALWIDGFERATDTSGSAPIGLNTLALDQAGGSNFNGKVKQLQVYKTALTDDELELLTGAISYGSFGELAEADGYTII